MFQCEFLLLYTNYFDLVLCKLKSWSNFECETSTNIDGRRLRKLIRIHAIRMNLSSAISAALTSKLLQYFSLWSPRRKRIDSGEMAELKKF